MNSPENIQHEPVDLRPSGEITGPQCDWGRGYWQIWASVAAEISRCPITKTKQKITQHKWAVAETDSLLRRSILKRSRPKYEKLTGPMPRSVVFLLRFIFMCLCKCVPHVCGKHRSQKRVSGPPELQLEVTVSHPVWVLGTTPCCPGRTRSALTAERSLQTGLWFLQRT